MTDTPTHPLDLRDEPSTPETVALLWPTYDRAWRCHLCRLVYVDPASHADHCPERVKTGLTGYVLGELLHLSDRFPAADGPVPPHEPIVTSRPTGFGINYTQPMGLGTVVLAGPLVPERVDWTPATEKMLARAAEDRMAKHVAQREEAARRRAADLAEAARVLTEARDNPPDLIESCRRLIEVAKTALVDIDNEYGSGLGSFQRLVEDAQVDALQVAVAEIALDAHERPPADDVREALDHLDALNESGRIQYADYVALHDMVSRIEIRPRGTVTDAEGVQS